MNHKFTLPLFFLCLCFLGHAQDLSVKLHSADTIDNPLEKIEILNSYKQEFAHSSDTLKSEYYLQYAIAYGTMGLVDSAISYFQRVIFLNKEGGDHYQLARGYSGIGNVLRRTGRNEESLDHFQKALTVVENKQDSASIRFYASIIYNLSGIYFDMRQLDRAREFTEQSIELSTKLNDGDQLAYCYVGLAFIALNEGNYQEAEEASKKAAKYIEEYDNDYLRGFNTINLAEIYEEQGKLGNAEKLYRQMIQDETGNIEVSLSGYSNLARLKILQKQPDEAISLAKAMVSRAIEREVLPYIRDAHELLYQAYELKGDYKASLAEHKEYLLFKDSLLNIEAINSLNEMEKKYEGELKQKQIEALAFENEQNVLLLDKQESEKLMYIFAIVALLVVIGLGSWQVIQKSKFNKTLSDKNATISNALKEREILLKEIHHRVKNNLQIISSLLNLQARFIKDQTAVDAVQEGRNRVKSMALIHQKLYQQDNIEGIDMPEYIDNLMSSLVSSYKITNDRLTISKEVSPILLDIDTAIPLGLIINELLTNSLKYAFTEDQTGELKIKLFEEENSLNLEVSDNGVGFETKSSSGKNSFGLTLIDSLAEKLDASVQSFNDQGTRYLIKVSNYKLA
ncbi:histidine kinase dimerization/phosphoacceptor domain -containing protein [Marinoscillum pacificum]|uniref:histidine kinase dimerization/phosphoacceptor domain -containing protein n=1 Tax=Marinoscillum pacificum TaxID=392723 RepID=UPI00215819B6|nr:histidine kinase dimerization/phosphoacceptor domain -containing protein [Marinoscillum pacificum]